MSEPTENAPQAPQAEDAVAQQPAQEPGEPTATEPAAKDEEAAAAPEEDIKSKKVTLADLSAKGAALYAQRSFDEAAEVFSEASNLQAEINGETSPDNAEILFHYGRSLFKVGQAKSNVLGGAAGGAEKKGSGANGKAKAKAAPKAAGGEGSAAASSEKKEESGEKKPLFQFTGDENFDDDSDEDEEQGDGEEQDDEDDDLSIAFEILDLARVCYVKQLETKDEEDRNGEGKGKETATSDSSAVRHIKERLADTHDALAEISLENEKYPQAIEDGRTSLQYKLQLYPEDSEIIAEAHFKLSLALEFASVTTAGTAGEGVTGEASEDMDQGMRDEAVKEMELALRSFKLKMQNKEVELATMASPEDNDLARRAIQDMKEVILDMEQRLVDLKNGPIDTKDLLGQEANPLGGLLGAAASAGESKSETKARVEEAKKTATDLSGLVRKKKPAPAPAADDSATNGKRKAEDEVEAAAESPKKAKVEDA